jgi:hypothetical protein
MVWLESGLTIAAYAATLIGTLRAGSRVVYLSQHSAIGIVEGPLILPPPPTVNATTTDNTPVNSGKRSHGPTIYELSEAFRECVGLSLHPQQYRGVRQVENTTHADATTTTRDGNNNIEEGPTPYSLSPFPKPWKDSRLGDSSDGDVKIGANIEATLDEIDGSLQQITDLSVITPERFAHLRSIFGISDQSFEQSMLATGPFVSFQSNSKGAARSGGVFFFTRDGAYMIKTIKVRHL